MSDVLYSLLDLVPIARGGTVGQAFDNAVDLARHAESWGFHRYWVAEHHSIPGIASAATAVVIGHVAAGTSRIRVGSGGIMLPNHAPLVIAEQFATLEALYPGRVDLGLGRAPGGDQPTMRALRRGLGSNGDTFPQDVVELQSYLAPADPGALVRAVPGQGSRVPLYLLGSSTFSAQLAAGLGLPFGFASHFAPGSLHDALELYRDGFRPSSELRKPHVMVGVNVVAAESDEEAERLFTTLQQMFLNMIRNTRGEMPPPVDCMEGLWSPAEETYVQRMLRYAVVGGPAAVREGLERILDETRADELIITAQIYDHGARLHSFELAAQAFRALNETRSSGPAAMAHAG